jgi:uncharacterized protein
MPRRPRFVADAMLGSLARKLRIFGFDTLYFKEGDDAELETLGKTTRRVILTSDRLLYERARAKGLRSALVVGSNDTARLRSVIDQAGQDMGSHLHERTSRCAMCNGELKRLGRKEAEAASRASPELRIPAGALARHRLFYICTSCSRFYWQGKHWQRLRRIASSLTRQRL